MSNRKPTLFPEVAAMVRDTILAANIPGLEREVRISEDMGKSVSAEWRQRFGIDARICVNFRADGDSVDGVLPVKPEIDVGWSCSIYTPTAARAAVALHSAVTDLACLISAQLEGVNVAIGLRKREATAVA